MQGLYAAKLHICSSEVVATHCMEYVLCIETVPFASPAMFLPRVANILYLP
jgi:hypothetical protein